MRVKEIATERIISGSHKRNYLTDNDLKCEMQERHANMSKNYFILPGNKSFIRTKLLRTIFIKIDKSYTNTQLYLLIIDNIFNMSFRGKKVNDAC